MVSTLQVFRLQLCKHLLFSSSVLNAWPTHSSSYVLRIHIYLYSYIYMYIYSCVQIMILLIVQFSPASCCLLLLSYKYSLQRPVVLFLYSLCSSFRRDTKFHIQTKKPGKIIVSRILIFTFLKRT